MEGSAADDMRQEVGITERQQGDEKDVSPERSEQGDLSYGHAGRQGTQRPLTEIDRTATRHLATAGGPTGYLFEICGTR